MANLHFQLSWYNQITKLPPPTQHHSFFRNFHPVIIVEELLCTKGMQAEPHILDITWLSVYLWVRSRMLAYRRLHFTILVRLVVVGKESVWKFWFTATHLSDKQDFCSLYTYPSIFHGRWIALSSYNNYTYVCDLYLIVSKLKAIHKNVTCLDSII